MTNFMEIIQKIKGKLVKHGKDIKLQASLYLQLFILAAEVRQQLRSEQIGIYGGKLVNSPPPSTSLLRRLSSPSI